MHFKYFIRGMKYTYFVVQPSISRKFSPSQTETLYPQTLTSHSSFLLTPVTNIVCSVSMALTALLGTSCKGNHAIVALL